MIIIVVSNSWRIQYSMTSPRILRLDTTSFRIGSRRDLVMLQYISTDEQVAYILTKSLEKGKFSVLQRKTLSGEECLPR
jgi:hypothetical protein